MYNFSQEDIKRKWKKGEKEKTIKWNKNFYMKQIEKGEKDCDLKTYVNVADRQTEIYYILLICIIIKLNEQQPKIITEIYLDAYRHRKVIVLLFHFFFFCFIFVQLWMSKPLMRSIDCLGAKTHHVKPLFIFLI